MIILISYAYRDQSRAEESIIYAVDCNIMDKSLRMYCPNPDCDAHMFICNLSPDKNHIKPYFRATQKNHGHIEGCKFAKLSFRDEDFNELEFDFDKITHNVMKPSKTGQETHDTVIKRKNTSLPPHTIKQIFELAKSNDINYSYNGTKIWQLLADQRSSHIYRKGIFRDCLVEASFAGYKLFNKTIRLKYYVDQSNYHYIKLYFNDDEVYHKALKLILDAKPSPVIVWGQYKPVDYYYKAVIYSLNQLYIPK